MGGGRELASIIAVSLQPTAERIAGAGCPVARIKSTRFESVPKLCNLQVVSPIFSQTAAQLIPSTKQKPATHSSIYDPKKCTQTREKVGNDSWCSETGGRYMKFMIFSSLTKFNGAFS